MHRGRNPETAMTNTKPSTKRAQLMRLVSRKSGASIEAIQRKLEWQPHTIRAEISRLRKQGLVVTCVSSPKGPVYRAQVPEQA
jgi:predicted ArsR family transcriptional regulator